MPSREETAYFGAGPAALPTPVIQKAAEAFINFDNQGIGLAEISHRSAAANKVIADAKAALTHLYEIPSEEYEILFLQSGGSGEFSATAQNLVSAWVEKRRRKAVQDLGEGKDAEVLERVKKEVESELKCDYLVTGSWSLKASQEAARLIGARYVNIAADGRKYSKGFGKFTAIPDEKDWQLSSPAGSAFTYFCDNETVDGVEFPKFPESLKRDDRIVVADMSSNFVSRKINVRDYSVIFGGAQKNLGIAGITVVIIRKDILSLVPPPTFMHQLSGLLPSAIPPVTFTFSTIASNNSLYNTLPVFNLYVAALVLESLVGMHTTKLISGQEEVAVTKASRIYGVLDQFSNVYYVVPDKSIRSRMNICFRILPKAGGGVSEDGKVTPDEAREKEFLAGAEKRNLTGLKGHRSVGGIRASNYNAVSVESVDKLCAWLTEFAQS